MALDRLVPTSSTPGAIDGDAYIDAVQEELTGLWNRALIKLANVAGTANAITADSVPSLTGATVADGMPFILKPASTSTAAVTLKLDGGTAYDVRDKDGVALASSALVAARRYMTFFDGGVSKYIVLTEVGDAVAVPTSFVDYQAFTASGTWTKPARATANSVVRIQAWAAGGGGGTCGGGGGGYNERTVLASAMGATETVTIPAGGAVNTAGGNATVGSLLTAYGGGGAANGVSGAGGGGGLTAVGGNGTATSLGGAGGGPPLGAGAGAGGAGTPGNGNAGGGGGTNGGGGYGSHWGGGGGSGSTTTNGGAAVWGGGGGAGTSSSAGGVSIRGGSGGNPSVAGSAPAGGGGSAAAGARGEVRITTYI